MLLSVPRCSPLTYGPAATPSTSQPCNKPPPTSSAPTTSPPSPPTTPTSPPVRNNQQTETRTLLPTPYSLVPASPAPSTTLPGTSKTTSSSTGSRAPASSTSWFATSLVLLSKPPPAVSPPIEFHRSSPNAIVARRAPPHPRAASSWWRWNTDARHLYSPAPHRTPRHTHRRASRISLAAPPPTATAPVATGDRPHPRSIVRRSRSRRLVLRPLRSTRPNQHPH